MDTETRIDIWKRALDDPGKTWVLFEHGTCVVLTTPEGDLGAQATTILGAFGPVRAGSPAGDFGVIELAEGDGWVVTGHHPDVLTHVCPEEATDPQHLTVGLLGRAQRDRDGKELRVVHVEDSRSRPTTA